MSIIKTPAIVLKCDNYRETSKLIILFTLTHGKIRCIAKGVRKTNTKWGGALQTMAYLNIFFYYKENRTLNLLTNAEHEGSLSNLFEDYEKMKIGYRIVELVNKTTFEYHENAKLFKLLEEALQILNSSTKNYVNVLFKFEFALANILGFAIEIDKMKYYSNAASGRKIDNIYESGNKNGYSGEYLNEVHDTISDNKKDGNQIFELLKSGNFTEIIEFNLLKTTSSRIESFLESHFREHIENLGVFKTKKVINS